MPTPIEPTNYSCTFQQCKDREVMLRKVLHKLNLITSWFIDKYGNKESFPPDLKNIFNDPDSELNGKACDVEDPNIMPAAATNPTEPCGCTDPLCLSPTCAFHPADQILQENYESDPGGFSFGEEDLKLYDQNQVNPCSVRLIRLSSSETQNLKNLDRTCPKKPRKSNKYLAEKKHQCDLCEKAFRLPCKLRLHRMTHTGETQYTCEQCGKGFIKLEVYKSHLRRHTGDKPYKCLDPTCSKAFACPEDLRKHKVLHNGGRKKKHQCELCPKAFHYPNELRVHSVTHSGEGSFPCDICGRPFEIQKTMINHRMTHNGDKPFECDVPGCERKFKVKFTLEVHQKTAHSNSIGSYQCETCGKTIVDKRRLKLHQLTHNNGGVSFNCQLCDKKFSQKRYLEAHTERIHNAAREAGITKPFKCELCPSRYAFIKDLKIHQKNRHGDGKKTSGPGGMKTGSTSWFQLI